MSNAIEVRELTKRYKTFTLDGISFSVPAGYICGFIGRNGAGKTTTLKLMIGMTLKDGGSIEILGRDGGDVTVKEELGILFDNPNFQDDWTLLDIEKTLRPFYKRWDGEAFHKYLSRFELDVKQKYKTLSRGMKMKLGMAAVLSHDAKLLLLDEPTSGLDPVMRDEMLDILQDYLADGDNRSVLFSTHITSDLEKVADYIVYIDNGRILYSGLKDELVEKFCIVRGGSGDLPAEKRKDVLGLRERIGGFEGMVRLSDVGGFPPAVVMETATLDDIMVYMSRKDEKQ